jgi:hypothetical protein
MAYSISNIIFATLHFIYSSIISVYLIVLFCNYNANNIPGNDIFAMVLGTTYGTLGLAGIISLAFVMSNWMYAHLGILWIQLVPTLVWFILEVFRTDYITADSARTIICMVNFVISLIYTGLIYEIRHQQLPKPIRIIYNFKNKNNAPPIDTTRTPLLPHDI